MSGKVRTTAGRGRLFDSVLDTIGDTPCIRVNNLGPEGRDGSTSRPRLQSGLVGQGPAGGQHHRGGRARRDLEARADRGRGDQRQHRHRARHGVRPEGLSAGRHHGRQLLDRAPQADAHAGRQGRADAAGAKGLRHVPEGGRAGRGQRLVPGPPVRDAGQCRDPRGDDGARDPGRLQGRAARLVRHRLRHRRHPGRRRRACCASSGRRRRSCCASRPTPSWSAAARRRSAPPTARPPPAIPPSSRIPSRAGRPTSSRWCCRRRSTRSTSTSAWRSPAPRA